MYNILTFQGFINSGKDTCANYLVEKYGYEKISFATSLKDTCSSIFGWDREMLEGSTKESRAEREQIDQWWAKELEIPLFSPRLALQLIGTDVLRNHFHDSIWLLSVKKKILSSEYPVTISDVRFKNEVKLIKELGGKICLVSRGNLPIWYDVAKKASFGDDSAMNTMKTTYSKVHISEYDWLTTTPDYTIDNNKQLIDTYSTLDDLVKLDK